MRPLAKLLGNSMLLNARLMLPNWTFHPTLSMRVKQFQAASWNDILITDKEQREMPEKVSLQRFSFFHSRINKINNSLKWLYVTSNETMNLKGRLKRRLFMTQSSSDNNHWSLSLLRLITTSAAVTRVSDKNLHFLLRPQLFLTQRWNIRKRNKKDFK